MSITYLTKYQMFPLFSLNNPSIHRNESRHYRVSGELFNYSTFRTNVEKQSETGLVFMFTILFKIMQPGVLTLSRSVLKASVWKLAILKHRPC